MTKKQLSSHLIQYGIKSIEVERETKVVFDAQTFNERASIKAPTTSELQIALSNHLKSIG